MSDETQSSEPVLVQVCVDSITPWGAVTAQGELIYAVTISGKSDLTDVCFTETVYKASKTLLNLRKLQKHGSVIVALSKDWRYEYEPDGWLNYVFGQVTTQIEGIREMHPDVNTPAGYDKDLAYAVLVLLNEIYPNVMRSERDLKHALNNAPDDQTLLTALDALLGDGLIVGRSMRDNTSAANRLLTVANIQISRHGREHLSQPTYKAVESTSIIHGDQINNYGHAGAIGRASTGTVNHNTAAEAMFRELTQKVRTTLVGEPALETALQRLSEIQAARDQKTAFERYSQFTGLFADHVGLALAVAPYVVPMMSWINTLVS